MKKIENGSIKPIRHRLWTFLTAIFLVCVILGAVAACGLHSIKGKVEKSINLMQTIDKEEVKQMTNENLSKETATRLRDSWTVAAFGLDSRDGDGLSGANSDVIMLISMNGRSGEIKLVSVYRDTCLKTGEANYRKANSAYASGGPKRAVAMLNENLDLKIDDYIAVNWKAVADAINILGGVDLEITQNEFRYINSFITETVKSTGIGSVHLAKAGPNHLDGVQAVAYCRLRLMDDDFKRTQRQQRVIGLLLEKASRADYATLNQLIEVVLPQTASSIDAEDLYAVAGNVMKLKKPETTGFPSVNYCRTVDGASFVFADSLEENVKSLHEFLYGTHHYVPSKTVKEISLAVRRKAEGIQKAPAHFEETPASAPIIEETAAAEATTPAETETVILNETETAIPAEAETDRMAEAETGNPEEQAERAGETQGTPVITAPRETDGAIEPEPAMPENPDGFIAEGPGYDVPLPADEESKEDEGDVHMDQNWRKTDKNGRH